MMLFIWSLSELGSFGWIGSLIFAICAGLRLARFNVALDGPAKPAWQAAFFVGIPAPAGAVVGLLPVYLEFLGTPHGFWTAPIVLAYTLAIGFLMISRVPSWSGKLIGTKIPRDLVLPLFITLVATAALLASYPWLALSFACVAYLATLPFSWRSWHEQSRIAVVPDPGPSNVEPLRLEPPVRNRGGPRRQGRFRKGGP
jgi:CDP-diacylglycerol--serine O-phosphatidyltransferase